MLCNIAASGGVPEGVEGAADAQAGLPHDAHRQSARQHTNLLPPVCLLRRIGHCCAYCQSPLQVQQALTHLQHPYHNVLTFNPLQCDSMQCRLE